MPCENINYGIGSTTSIRPSVYESRNKMRPISISPLDYGFVVKVGCQEFAISDAKELLAKLTKYINNPEDTEKSWMEKNKI